MSRNDFAENENGNGTYRRSKKKLAVLYLGFAIMLVGMQIPLLMLHESFHKMMAEALGGTADVIFDYIMPMVPIAGRAPFANVSQVIPVYFAGGFFTALVAFFPWLYAWLTSERGDTWVEGLAASAMLSQIFYAPGEYFLYINTIDLYWVHTIFAAAFSQLVFFGIYTRPLVRWWLGKHLGTSKRKQACHEERLAKNGGMNE